MIEECPHCHTRVVPLKDNICPACHKSVVNQVGADLSVTTITVDDVRSLPPYCVLCGRETKRVQHLRKTRKDPDPSGSAAANRLALSQGGLVGELAAWILRFGKQDIVFSIPYCERCQNEHRRLSVRHVDWDRRLLTLLAHVDFKQRLVESGYNKHGV